jgi:hypothetical protein
LKLREKISEWLYLPCLVYTVFASRGTDVLSIVSFFPLTKSFVVSDPESVKYIVQERLRFVKPGAIYSALGLFGPNVGIVEGKEWTRHKRILAASRFNEVIIIWTIHSSFLTDLELCGLAADGYVGVLE